MTEYIGYGFTLAGISNISDLKARHSVKLHTNPPLSLILRCKKQVQALTPHYQCFRYVGTLHEINSENSTVALENVKSHGTEGRRPDDEVPASESIYEYIVFRGSDVKDLRIEEPPKENVPPKQPQVPDDPAILGSARRPDSVSTPQGPPPPHSMPGQQQQQGPLQDGQRSGPPSQFPNQSYNPYYYPPPNQRFGPPGPGFGPGPGFQGMPYGGPPGWYPPPGHGYPGHMLQNQFGPPQMPIGPPGQQQRQMGPPRPNQQGPAPAKSTSMEPSTTTPQPPSKPASPKPVAAVKLPSTSTTPNPPAPLGSAAPPPPTQSKPDVASALAPPVPISQQSATAGKSVPTGPKSNRIVPAIPLPSPNIQNAAPTNGILKPQVDAAAGKPTTAATTAVQAGPMKTAIVSTKTLEDANRDARAAVAAAMAKLPPQGQQKPKPNEVDNLTNKVAEMRTNDHAANNNRQRDYNSGGGYRGGGAPRGGRGGWSGTNQFQQQQSKKIDVPKTDYDFESANAKFNKQDLVKEAIATGSPIASSAEDATGTSSEAAVSNGSRKESVSGADSAAGVSAGYNRSTSFFDDISSEAKDRGDGGEGGRVGGREFRNEERQKNLETFGQGSVDGGFGRGGYGRGGRGRGRGGFTRGGGRGYAPRGGQRGGTGQRGGRGGAIATEG
ncbi:hypothetical protein MMC25_000880 [Agyrium rufum]|nr:hypothetical protein [Agyrium rufum]